MSKKGQIVDFHLQAINLQVASDKLYTDEMNKQKNIQLIMDQQCCETYYNLLVLLKTS